MGSCFSLASHRTSRFHLLGYERRSAVEVLRTLWPLRLMATDQMNCIHTNNNVMYVLLSYLCYHSKLCCQKKLSRLRIKHYFHKRRRQQHLYFKRRACSQRLLKAYHQWLLRNSSTTVNKVKGIEEEIFANYWRQKYPNGTLSW